MKILFFYLLIVFSAIDFSIGCCSHDTCVDQLMQCEQNVDQSDCVSAGKFYLETEDGQESGCCETNLGEMRSKCLTCVDRFFGQSDSAAYSAKRYRSPIGNFITNDKCDYFMIRYFLK